jgi:hypothetical protein
MVVDWAIRPISEAILEFPGSIGMSTGTAVAVRRCSLVKN